MTFDVGLDDFGAGYSSLADLKRFPVGKLKLSVLLCRILRQAIASTIVLMGHNLRLNVLAEGVESATQFELLRKIGCDMAQGYYFSRPVSAAQMAELLRDQPFMIKE